MHSFRRLALLLALVLPALYAAQAESSSSSSNPATPTPAAAQDQAQQPAAQSQPHLSVQARIRARREQRRVAAIHDVYDHRYEVSVGMGFQRTHAGVPQKVNEYAWDVGVTKYLNERLGLTVEFAQSNHEGVLVDLIQAARAKNSAIGNVLATTS